MLKRWSGESVFVPRPAAAVWRVDRRGVCRAYHWAESSGLLRRVSVCACVCYDESMLDSFL